MKTKVTGSFDGGCLVLKKDDMGDLTLSDFKQKLINNVRLSMVNLISEEDVEKFVDDCIVEFKKEEMRRVVMDELRHHCKKIARSHLDTLSAGDWDVETQQLQMNTQLKEIVEKAAPGVLVNLLTQAAQQLVTTMNNNLY